jgi:UPF0755 protein
MLLSDLLRLLRNCAIPIILGTCLIVGLIAAAVVALAPAGLNPVEALVLRVYLSRNDTELNTPHGNDPTVQRFVVEENDSARSIGINLVTQEFIGNGRLFERYVRFEGLDDDLRAGTFFISDSMTIPQIAAELTDPSPRTLRLLVVEGWRMEQIAEAIDAESLLDFSGNDFLALVGRGAPLPPEFQARHGIPAGASLEGFLFPATYEVRYEASAAELRDQMLAAFDANVNATMINDATAQGLSMFEAVTLAAIVEREAVLVEERPQIAAVYLNRQSIGQKLDADPTTQYGIGNTRDGAWWPRLTVEDYQLAHPYNTYVNLGLPPGPIANPGLSAIRAVIYPAVSPYFYFRAACDGSGAHQFSVTFEEHLSRACP